VEIQNPKARYRIIAYDRLMDLLAADLLQLFQPVNTQQVEEAMERKQQRQSQWSESLAVGSPAYVETFSKQRAPRANGRRALPAGNGCQLRGSETPYSALFGGENGLLSLKKSRFWHLSLHPKTT